MALVEALAAGAGGTQAFIQVLQALNQARSVVLEVDNFTSGDLTRISDHHDHGGFAVAPVSVIPSQKADVFGSQSKGGSLATGTEGDVTYSADGLQLKISWDNPFFGDNSIGASYSGPNEAKFRVVTTLGVGNSGAHMRYEVFNRTLANFGAQKHAGNPVLIQSRFGRQGNFELLVPLATGGLAAYFRDNDAPGLPWGGPAVFGTELGRVDSVTMIQSNFGSPGNLEVIARVGDRLKFFVRDSGPEFRWTGPFPLIVGGVEVTGVTGNPVLIQSRFGRQGNFELLVPLATGGLAAYFRDNDTPGLPWGGPVVFGSERYSGVSMIESNFGNPGNLEVVANVGSTFHFFFRDSGPAFQWIGPITVPLAGGVEPFVGSTAVMIQSRFGRQGNFEAIASEASFSAGEGIAAFFRDNDDPSFPWKQAPTFGVGASGTDRVGGLSLIQSNFGSPGNLEVVARYGDRLAFYFRDSGPVFAWNGPFFM